MSERIAPSTPPLYTPEQRRLRDGSKWTVVQGVLAPLQFAIFLTSLVLIVRYLVFGRDLELATASVVIKVLALYAIMITGAFWEHAVFGRYLFAPAFFWEDAFSMLVIALHSAYLAALWLDLLAPTQLLSLALAAYVSYAINATQFLVKLRLARRDASRPDLMVTGSAR